MTSGIFREGIVFFFLHVENYQKYLPKNKHFIFGYEMVKIIEIFFEKILNSCIYIPYFTKH